MSVPSSWRLFQLFDFTPIRDPSSGSDTPLYLDPSLLCVAATPDFLVVAVHGAYLKIVTKQFTLAAAFTAYDVDYHISFVEALPGSNLVVTLAERQGSPAVLKLWDLHKMIQLYQTEHHDVADDFYKHKYHTQVAVHNGDNSYPISCFAFNASLTCLAVGYASGKMILVRGDLVRDRGAKQRLVYESSDPITGIHFTTPDDLLYVTTTSRVLTVLTNGRNHGKPNRVLSKTTGVDLHCSDIDARSCQLVVGTSESIRYYDRMNKTSTINFPIPKKRILRVSKNYLLLVAQVEEFVNKQKKLLTKILIVDLFNKHVAFSLTMPNNTINHAFEMWNDVYLLTNDGILYKLHEKPINQQVELVLQRELFSIAYQLAVQADLDIGYLLRIEKLHGHYLYDKQDYEESITSYIKCLSLLNRSQSQTASLVSSEEEESMDDFIMTVITKFKDASNITNLTRFLYKLYEMKLVDNDHLTLLLCCYCKLKMTKELDSFIDDLNFDEQRNDDLKNKSKINFDQLNFQLIINLFKECGYFEQVIKLLYKLNQPNLIVGIQLNDLKQPEQCLRFIKSLSIDELLLILIDHLKHLLDSLPLETTELLINVFTGKYKPSLDVSVTLFDNVQLVEKKELIPAPDDASTNGGVALNSYKAFVSYISGMGASDHEQAEVPVDTEPTYLPPKPGLIFPSFINNPKEFVIFLEACIQTFDLYQGNVNDKKDLLITLFEMYLSLAAEEEDKSEEWINKVKSLISEYATLLDKSDLLLISHIFDFKEGELLAKEQSGGFEEGVFRTSIAAGDVKNCLDIIYKHGESHPELFKIMLRFIVSKEEIFNQVDTKDFRYILETIKRLNLARPLEIISILSSNEFTTIGLVKDYLIEYIDLQNKEISNNSKLILSYESESTKNSHKLNELTRKPFIIQNNKCDYCQLKLDFPIVHFKCKHSFHQRCLNDNNYVSETDASRSKDAQPMCPLCINELDSVQALRNSQLASKDNQELFEAQLNDTTDRFKVMSGFLGRGLMENDLVVLDS